MTVKTQWMCIYTVSTTEERFNVNFIKHISHYASNTKSDMSGFLAHPKKRQTQRVVYELDRQMIEVRPSHASSTFVNDLWFVQSSIEPAVTPMFCGVQLQCLGDLCWERYRSRHLRWKSWWILSFHSEQCCWEEDRFSLSSRPELSPYRLSAMKPIYVRAQDEEASCAIWALH